MHAEQRSGKNCHRVKFVWDGNGTNFAQAAVKNAISAYGTNWMLMTNDYVWGHNTSAATRKLVEQYGGEITDEILVPQGTRDFSAILLKVQQASPQVVAAAVGGDDQKAMRQQVAELGLGESMAWTNNQQDWPDVYGLPLENLFGVFGTTWLVALALGLSLELDAMGVVDDAVEDRVRVRWLHYVSLTTGNELDICKSIAWELGLPIERSRASAHQAIRNEISRLVTEAKQLPILVIDEAHHLRNDVLEDRACSPTSPWFRSSACASSSSG